MMGTNDKAMLGTSGYERVEHDLYETPAWCTDVLLRHVVFKKVIFEPAAGRGAIARVLNKSGYTTVCQDLVLRDYQPCAQADFFNTKFVNPSMDIITNPPYEIAEQFVRHALSITGPFQKVAMLLRNEWDCAHTRTDLFKDSNFKLKIVLTRRPRWVKESTGAPRHNYAWYVWDHNWFAPPELIYDR
jgi:hypothetical protein